MSSLGTTLAKLIQQQRMAEFSGPATPMADGSDRLADMHGFGSNPGALHARTHVPAGLTHGAPLVVVLHGCTQTANEYANGSGWTELADECRFAVLLPEQQRVNNLNLCFNWFTTTDNRRDGGEALSIFQMIAAMVERHGSDPQRIFITGLSAGGAMASIMLASYPEVFKGGAIIAGLPFGSADSMGDAFARMRGDGHLPDAELAALVRQASDHAGPWPNVAVWHGTADTVVDPSNSERIVGQWQAVHGVNGVAPDRHNIDGGQRRIWRNADGQPVIEAWQIDKMGHGTPIGTGGADDVGSSGPFMLDVGISSTRHIAASWGLAPMPASRPVRQAAQRPAQAQPGAARWATARPVMTGTGAGDRSVAAIIDNALRAAGLKQ